MGKRDKPSGVDRRQYTFNMALVATAGGAGCITVAILFVALFAGLWLDNKFASEDHLFTIILLIVSVPVTLAAMLWLVRTTTSRIRPASREETTQEEAERAGTS